MHYAGRVSIDALFSFNSFGIILPNPLGHGVFRCDANSKFFAMFLSFRFSPLSIVEGFKKLANFFLSHPSKGI